MCGGRALALEQHNVHIRARNAIFIDMTTNTQQIEREIEFHRNLSEESCRPSTHISSFIACQSSLALKFLSASFPFIKITFSRSLPTYLKIDTHENRYLIKVSSSFSSLSHQAAQEDAGNNAKLESTMDIPLKKLKHEEVSVRYLDIYQPAAFIFPHVSRPQAWMANSPKQPFTPFASSMNPSALPYTQEPPLLQNPERVVRHTESERFERSYQPNVALAPRQTILARERDKEEVRESSTASIIKSEMQIKQERPSTPINGEQTSSPTNIRNSSPETTINGGALPSATAPISPEGQSGSNEITSSTSPVPASMIPNIKQDSVSPHSSPSLTSPPPRSHMIHHKSSPVVVTVVTNNHHHHHHQPVMNGIKKKVPAGNTDFEMMSPDTDEESLTGEPDSSNHTQTAYEHVRELLANGTLESHNRILHIVKYLEKEIVQTKERFDGHKKEMIELQAQQQLREEELRRKIDSLQLQLNQQKLNGNGIIATSCLSSSSSSSSSLSSSSSYDYDRNERRNSIVEKPNVIIKPLKKSWRLTSCEEPAKTSMTTTATANITITTSTPSTIVMMPKTEDMINNNNTKIYNNNNNSSTSSPIINGSTESASSLLLDDALKQKTTTANVATVVAAATPIKTEKL